MTKDPLRERSHPSGVPREKPVAGPFTPRRRRLQNVRRLTPAQVDRVLSLREHLSAPDRALIDAVLASGQDVAALARIVGARRQSLRRRLVRLLARVLDPVFAFVVVNAPLWPETRRRVATLVIVEGRTQRAAAGELAISIHHVRREIEAVRVLVDQARAMGRLS